MGERFNIEDNSSAEEGSVAESHNEIDNEESTWVKGALVGSALVAGLTPSIEAMGEAVSDAVPQEGQAAIQQELTPDKARANLLQAENQLKQLEETYLEKANAKVQEYIENHGGDANAFWKSVQDNGGKYPEELARSVDQVKADYRQAKTTLEMQVLKVSPEERKMGMEKMVQNLIGKFKKQIAEKHASGAYQNGTWEEFFNDQAFWDTMERVSREFSTEGMQEFRTVFFEKLKAQTGVDEPTPPAHWNW
jgi:F0F1-type ATP synthase membrane subunit b/b'